MKNGKLLTLHFSFFSGNFEPTIMKIILYILLAYVLYKFIFRFIIPVAVTTRQVKKQFREMHEQMNEKQQSQSADPLYTPGEQSRKKPTQPQDKGDYIDFEEVK
jgi:Domain of unknown function (DUF4834)